MSSACEAEEEDAFSSTVLSEMAEASLALETSDTELVTL